MDEGHFELISTSSSFILQKDSSDSELHIDRSISQIQKKKSEKRLSTPSEKIFGIFGLIQLPSSSYLILITKAIHVCRIKDSFIYMIQDIEFRPFNSITPTSPSYLSDQQTISSLRSLIKTSSFYFSYTYDLTLSLQKIAESGKNKSIYERSDEKYYWNKHLSEGFIKADASEFTLIVVNGFVKGESVEVKGKRLDYVLISRRDKRRTGTRFNTRGLDDQGNAVNFVETEQIVIFLQEDTLKIFSHVQIRGSIPLIWQQKPNLSWTPRPKVLNSTQLNSSAAESHFSELHSTYGSVSLINLIDKKGSQKMIGTIFSNLSSLLSNKKLFYTWFDFHHECKNMKYENLKFLLKELQSLVEEFNWCELELRPADWFDKARVVRRQVGVFRTNCMDCLDRTNVVQSVLARNVLLRQLSSVGLGPSPSGEAFQAFSNSLEGKFRDLWVQNADLMSLLYSGTPAQKTDFTKMGKRTFKGAFNDGVYSVQRFVINNFLDGSKQNAMDVMLGRLSIRTGVNLEWKFKSLITFLAVLLVGFVLASSLAWGKEGFSYWTVFFTSFLLFGNLVKAFGTSLVDKPVINTN